MERRGRWSFGWSLERWQRRCSTICGLEVSSDAVRRVRLGAQPAIVGIAARACRLDGGALRYTASAALTEALMEGAELLPVILPLTGVNQTLLLRRVFGALL